MAQKEPWTLWMNARCSLDVVSLCTCIPIQGAISITVDPIQDTTHHHLIYSVRCSTTCTSPLKTAYSTNRRPPNAFGFQHIRHLGILFMDELESALSHTDLSAHTRDMQMTSSFTQAVKKRQTISATP